MHKALECQRKNNNKSIRIDSQLFLKNQKTYHPPSYAPLYV